MAALDGSSAEQSRQSETVAQLLTLRLAEAVASRELLLHELTAVIRQETKCDSIVILEADSSSKQRVVISHGLDEGRTAKLATALDGVQTDKQLKSIAEETNSAVINLKPEQRGPCHAGNFCRARLRSWGGLSLDPLLRIVELGRMYARLRERNRSSQQGEESDPAGASLMPGLFIPVRR